ncbi:UDP-N-acetylmuramoyl-L-alanyl-D-glutamate--2,6-diaminopimelate ligase [Rhodococcus qingshengii]|uniref:UDP-N-acetylmuramoyl-L-alanyl-D-glutamate--2, 6-diaminopimelate ligase n=1 Tax=Rhodococcus qingshengii TaxID=334542 RepID=UPI001BE8196D|nr:UDP-N-acetylmuramoyl-L-alanyl-D-glutamate--2,6-diaminopimelate ligase [Rhodococcus qingshengii]MBT2273560.1 UDP-N-acetylmuramoyl-L-alanyl-D-glutamate--2,6-diaminopimelate ligase [Rhodococcus qingshengii]
MSHCDVLGHRPLGEIARYLGVAQSVTLTCAQQLQTVTGISQDSRLVRPGDLYVALPGLTHHGAAFAVDAAGRGAVAMISDRPSEVLPSIVVDEPRQVLGSLAAWFYGEPSTLLDVYAVTGTNGKTSTAYLLDAGLAGAGHLTGMITGIEVRGPDGSRAAQRTTPEASQLQRTLAGFVRRQVRAVAMEVSSHALALHRVDGTLVRVAVFTNLGRDHLDFHPSMQAYFEAKKKLFDPERCRSAAIGIDDEYGRRLAAGVAVPYVTFSTRDDSADMYATDVEADHEGTSFTVHREGKTRRARLQLLGEHQVDNALAALAALSIGGVEFDSALTGMEGLDAVPGRLTRVDVGQGFLAFVDYVHNSAGQRRLFPYLRSLTSGKIIAVVGATGGRDRGKRMPLGFLAASFADIVVVTDESPFFDDAHELRREVAEGARRAKHALVEVISNRRAAIMVAVAHAEAGDVVVITGRGHDRVVNRGGIEETFDDRAALEQALVSAMDPDVTFPTSRSCAG